MTKLNSAFDILTTFNSSFLSWFSQNNFGPDVRALVKRFQVLLIIYINILMSFFYLLWLFLKFLGFQLPAIAIGMTFPPLMILSFITLKAGYNNISAIFVLGYFHINVFIGIYVNNMVLPGICGVISLPIYGFLLTSLKKIHVINVMVTLLQDVFLTRKMNEKFGVMLTEEQAAEILPVNLICFITIIVMTVFCLLQKTVETNLWTFAQDNYERTLSVTKELVEAAEAKDIFVSSLSYEIQSPLNNMKANIDSLLRLVKDSTNLQAIRNIKLNTEILSNIVGNLLDIAKIKSDKIELSYKESGSIELLKKVVMIHIDSLKEKEIETRILIDKNLPSTLWIDSPRVLQIILNIFSNALKFTARPGKISLMANWTTEEQNHETLVRFIKENQVKRREEIVNRPSEEEREDRHSWSSQMFDEFSFAETHIRSQNLKDLRRLKLKKSERGSSDEDFFRREGRFFEWKMDRTKDTQELLNSLFSFVRQQENVAEKGYFVVRITDTGCGIPRENLLKLFERFSPIDHNLAQLQREKGLGLWMTKQLCKKMGGDIAVESCLNQGSTFAFYIPVNNVHLIEASRNRARVSRDKIRALVVDDYAYNRDLHKLLVEREGVQQVVTACDGKEAVERYISKGDDYYDFIMMDVQMPEMDGFTAAKKIRQYEEEKKWKRVDIYFVSGEYYSEEDIVSELRTKGQMDTGVRCLRKPLGIDMIRQIVQNYGGIKPQTNI